MRDGQTRWKSIRKLSDGACWTATRPSRSSAVLKEDDKPTEIPEEVRSPWHQQFTKILYITIEFFEYVVEDMTLRQIRSDLDNRPTVKT